MQQQEVKLNLETRDVILFIKDTCEQFSDLSIRKGIQFKIESAIRSAVYGF